MTSTLQNANVSVVYRVIFILLTGLLTLCQPSSAHAELSLMPFCSLMEVSVDPNSGIIALGCQSTGISAVNGSNVQQLVSYAECPTLYAMVVHPITSALFINCGGPTGQPYAIQMVAPWQPHVFNVYQFNMICNDIIYSFPTHQFVCNAGYSGIFTINDTFTRPPVGIGGCPGGAQVNDIAVSFIDDIVYVACDLSGALAINLTSHDTITFLNPTSTPACGIANTVAVTQDNTMVVVGCDVEGLFTLTNHNTVITTLSPTCIGSSRLVTYNLDGQEFVFAVCRNELREFNLASNYISSTTLLPMTFVWSMVVYPFPRLIYANDSGSDTSHRPLLIAGYSTPYVTVCGPGEYGIGGRSPCFPCQRGTYSSVVGDSACRSLCPGGMASNTLGATSINSCISCTEGKYTTTNGSSMCSSCYPGSYNPTVGAVSATACIPCALGYASTTYAASQNWQCTPCAAGRYANNAGTSVCTACNPGRFNGGTGASNPSACSPCPLGSASSLSGISACSNCLPGTYGAQMGLLQCTTCPNGTYQSIDGQSMCTACSPGTFNAYDGQQSPVNCISCPPGRFQLSSGSNECESCAPGSYSSSGAAVCTLCAQGSYQPSNTSFMCLTSPENTYQPHIGATSQDACIACPIVAPAAPVGSTSLLQCQPPLCADGNFTTQGEVPCSSICTPGGYCVAGQRMECPRGTYNNLFGSTSSSACIACASGSIAPYSNAASCQSCDRGYYQDQTGQISCTPCATNTYQPNFGAVSAVACVACPPSAPKSPMSSTSVLQCIAPVCPDGTFSEPNQVACQGVCPLGHFCTAGNVQECPVGFFGDHVGSAGCSPCQAGTYSTSTGAVTSGTCKTCPISSYSTAGSASCTLCGVGNTTALPEQVSADACVRIVGCATNSSQMTSLSLEGALCPLSFDAPVNLSSILPFGQNMIRSWDTTSATDDAAQYDAYFSSYAPSKESSSSLRVAMYPAETAGSENDETSTASATAPSTSINSLSTGMFILVLVGSCVAILPLLLFRYLPAKVALVLDRFSWHQSAAAGDVKKRQPTQFGAAFSITFVLCAVMVGVILCISSNTETTTTLIPPSALAASGTAKTQLQVSFRVYMSAEYLDAHCPGVRTSALTRAAPFSATQVGFSEPFRMQTDPHVQTASCYVALDCDGCTLAGSLPVLNITFPFSAQLIEWEVRTTGAIPHTASSRYGVLSQQPGHLLDSRGDLRFTVTEAFFQDFTSSASSSGGELLSGYDMDFAAYAREASQSTLTFNADSTVGISLSFSKSPVVFQTVLKNKLSVLQQVTLVLSAISSLFGVFIVLYGLLATHVIPKVRVVPGLVVEERSGVAKDCRVFIKEDETANEILPYVVPSDDEDALVGSIVQQPQTGNGSGTWIPSGEVRSSHLRVSPSKPSKIVSSLGVVRDDSSTVDDNSAFIVRSPTSVPIALFSPSSATTSKEAHHITMLPSPPSMPNTPTTQLQLPAARVLPALSPVTTVSSTVAVGALL